MLLDLGMMISKNKQHARTHACDRSSYRTLSSTARSVGTAPGGSRARRRRLRRRRRGAPRSPASCRRGSRRGRRGAGPRRPAPAARRAPARAPATARGTGRAPARSTGRRRRPPPSPSPSSRSARGRGCGWHLAWQTPYRRSIGLAVPVARRDETKTRHEDIKEGQGWIGRQIACVEE